jgi:hypothetical protein
VVVTVFKLQRKILVFWFVARCCFVGGYESFKEISCLSLPAVDFVYSGKRKQVSVTVL